MGTLADALRITDAEILADAMGDNDFDEGNPAYLNMPEGEGADDWLEQTEGFDGEPVSDIEQFATASGDAPEGYLGDRPLQFMHEQELMAENARLRELNNLNVTALNEFVGRPQAEAERLRQADELLDIALDTQPGGRLDQFVNGIRGQSQYVGQMQRNRLEASFHAAERDYGDEFAERAKWLNDLSYRANRGDQVAAATVREIVNQPDAGRALMQWEDRNPYQPPPFMGGQRRAVTPSRQAVMTYDDLEASGDSDEEAVFNYAAGDSRDHPDWKNYGG
jgi:hypothetical protein